ncbi:MAG: succinate dehydrogenase assembly factor 2 [Brevundimonas sp.]|nr:MAG: succinate dehydrogenase assembly factor 2 [Brevundimonas sp.]
MNGPARNRVADNDSRPDTHAQRLGRMRFRAWRRGFREADMVLGPFADAQLESLSDSELDAFETLLNEDDAILYAWIVGREPAPAAHAGPVMDRLQVFMRDHVAKAVSEGIG